MRTRIKEGVHAASGVSGNHWCPHLDRELGELPRPLQSQQEVPADVLTVRVRSMCWRGRAIRLGSPRTRQLGEVGSARSGLAGSGRSGEGPLLTPLRGKGWRTWQPRPVEMKIGRCNGAT